MGRGKFTHFILGMGRVLSIIHRITQLIRHSTLALHPYSPMGSRRRTPQQAAAIGPQPDATAIRSSRSPLASAVSHRCRTLLPIVVAGLHSQQPPLVIAIGFRSQPPPPVAAAGLRSQLRLPAFAVRHRNLTLLLKGVSPEIQ
jgi:hypothetical protein